MAKLLEWFGFGDQGHAGEHSPAGRGQAQGEASAHGHTHGVIDPTLTTTDRGIWAIKWSFAILAVTAVLQLIVVYISGSVALLADTIHNVGDATTAIPLWVAFVLGRRKPSRTFAYGLGRVEDLAGILIVLMILFSAIVAGYVAIDRLLHPQPVTELGWLAAAGIVGFLGNEAVAVFRIRVGRQMNSAALIADGYHARTDGLTSLAVVLGAVGVWLGFPLADPIIGLLITVAILGIVWQSARAVITRTLDGVEPGVTDAIRGTAGHVPGVARVADVKARWIGHQLHADVAVVFEAGLTLAAAAGVAGAIKEELRTHMPALRTANITLEAPGEGVEAAGSTVATARTHHAPDPVRFASGMAAGMLKIVDTAEGERMRLVMAHPAPGLMATVTIDRVGRAAETLTLAPLADDQTILQSRTAPAEPHEFTAQLHLALGDRREVHPFRMAEPVEHHH